VRAAHTSCPRFSADNARPLPGRFVDEMDADLGGTNILAPLEAVFALPPTHRACESAPTRSAVRNVFLLTDGEVGPFPPPQPPSGSIPVVPHVWPPLSGPMDSDALTGVDHRANTTPH
jgi:hypothetical protein